MRNPEEFPDRDEMPEESGSFISIEGWGIIKAKFQPRATDEPAPDSWREVWERTKSDFKRLAVTPLGFLADTFEGARNVVRGIFNVRTRTDRFARDQARKVEAAHVQVDETEARKQIAVEERRIAKPHLAQQALDRFDTFLKDRCIVQEELPDGRWAFYAVKPEEVEAAREAARAAGREVLVSPQAAAKAGASLQLEVGDSGSGADEVRADRHVTVGDSAKGVDEVGVNPESGDDPAPDPDAEPG